MYDPFEDPVSPVGHDKGSSLEDKPCLLSSSVIEGLVEDLQVEKEPSTAEEHDEGLLGSPVVEEKEISTSEEHDDGSFETVPGKQGQAEEEVLKEHVDDSLLRMLQPRKQGQTIDEHGIMKNVSGSFEQEFHSGIQEHGKEESAVYASLGRPVFLPSRGPPDLLKPLLSGTDKSPSPKKKKRGHRSSSRGEQKMKYSKKHHPPPAPPLGYSVKFSERKGRWFWTNTSTQQSQWEPPSSTTATKKGRTNR